MNHDEEVLIVDMGTAEIRWVSVTETFHCGQEYIDPQVARVIQQFTFSSLLTAADSVGRWILIPIFWFAWTFIQIRASHDIRLFI